MLNIKVYNAEQIGGCYTVITSDKAKIMIDYGLALPGTKRVQEDFDWENETVDAVFITHSHGDHVGRILEIPDGIPIYMGSATKKILLNIHETLTKVPELKDEHQKWVDLLNSKWIKEVKEKKTITLNNAMKVTPYSVDHSAYDAYMYLVEADDEVALHTGDFRGHGYRGKALLKVIKYYVHKNGRKVDYLITEGTMMADRIGEKIITEEELKDEATKLFSQNKYVFLVISSTNLDSLASFYKAGIKNRMHMYCYNYYFYSQLKIFTNTAGRRNFNYRFKNVHTVDFENMLHSESEYWDGDKTQEELMRKYGFICIIKPEEKYHKWIERFKDKNPLVVYSMWDGYINKEVGKEAYIEEWAKFFAPYDAKERFCEKHTSGHATAQMIADVIKAVEPQKAIIPMHTENVEGFKKLEIDEKYKEMINKKE